MSQDIGGMDGTNDHPQPYHIKQEINMYTPTAAQKEAAQAKREAFKALTKKIAAMPEAERLALASKVLAHNPEGHQFSPTNQMLIAYQFDGATICAGFQQWRKLGRMVRKGEHGIAIWIPCTKKADPNKQPGETSADELDLYFTMSHIFDVSQTEEMTQ
jgi:hypothetical protein